MVTKTETHHEFTDEDVSGKNFVETLENKDVYRITLESEKQPSNEFIKRTEEFGFKSTIQPPLLEEGKFITTFYRL